MERGLYLSVDGYAVVATAEHVVYSNYSGALIGVRSTALGDTTKSIFINEEDLGRAMKKLYLALLEEKSK